MQQNKKTRQLLVKPNTKHLVSSMQPSTLHSITVLDLSYHESGENTLIWKANVITLKKEGKCSICWHHSSIYLPSFQGTHSWQSKLWCICAPRCFLQELSHTALGASRQINVCAMQRTCPRLLHLPPKSLSYGKYIKHSLNCLSLSCWHVKNLLRFCQECLNKSSLRKVVKRGK